MLRYSYDASVISSGSALRTYINGKLINEAQLLNGSGTVSRQRQALLPTANLRPFTNTLNLNFDFVPVPVGAPGKLQGKLLENSSLDLRGLAHWVELPNLELFANAGFPFTQYADLAKTVVMLPRELTNTEITLSLTMLSHFGRQTGYPAVRVQVATPDDVIREDRDYLILGSFGSQPAFAALHDSLPVALDPAGAFLGSTKTYLSRAQHWWTGLTGATPADQEFAARAG